MTTANTRSVVLICEDRAHLPTGHWGIRFAELAEGFAKAGCNIHILTAWGWKYEAEFSFEPKRIHKYSRTASLLLRFSLIGRYRWNWWRGRNQLRTLALALAARQTLRKIAVKQAVIISVSSGIEPAFLAIAGGQHDWIVHYFQPPPRPLPIGLSSLIRRATEWRGARKLSLLVAVPNETIRMGWQESRPEQTATVLRLAGATSLARHPNARKILGLPATSRVALLFGEYHDMKWPHTALEAIQLLPNWTLYVVGGIAQRLASAVERGEELPPNVILTPGPISNFDRHCWHQAADLAVLSFAPNYARNSGTLMDALSAGCPVVVSDKSFAAALVRMYALGEIFQPGDARDLVASVHRTKALSKDVINAALSELGNERLAKDHLNALEFTKSQTPSGGE